MQTPSVSPATQAASSANNHSAAVDLFANHNTTPAPVTNRSRTHTHSTLQPVVESLALHYPQYCLYSAFVLNTSNDIITMVVFASASYPQHAKHQQQPI